MKNSASPLPQHAGPIGDPKTNPIPAGLQLFMRNERAKQQKAVSQGIEAYKKLAQANRKQHLLARRRFYEVYGRIKMDNNKRPTFDTSQAAYRIRKLALRKFKSTVEREKNAGKNILNLGLASKELGDYMRKSARPLDQSSYQYALIL